MVKTKEAKWTGQKMMYKDGDVGVFRKFGWETWRRMTEDERAMWTELSVATPAPISKEVIEFNKKVSKQLDAVVIPEPEKVEVHSDEIEVLEPLTGEEQAKAAIKAELKLRGIYFHPNSKLETLQKKLANADNPE